LLIFTLTSLILSVNAGVGEASDRDLNAAQSAGCACWWAIIFCSK